MQRVLHTLAATEEVPRHTRLHSRGNTRVPPTSRGALLPSHSSRGGIFPCVFGKEFPAFPSHLKRRRSHRKGERNSRVVPQSQSSPDSQSIPGKRVFPALPRLSSRGSSHTTVARGTALWESLVGKPSGKASAKATDPLIHAKGRATLLLRLGSKAQGHAPLETRTDSSWETPEVPQDPCRHWRGILRFRHQLHTRS